MNPQEKEQFNKAMEQVSEMYAFYEQQKQFTQVELSSFANGLKIVGRTEDTTPASGIIINTEEGPITLLRA